jgi:Skp family chaperone for outer membrane proteins
MSTSGNSNNESKALGLAERMESERNGPWDVLDAAAELRRQHAEIESLRAQLADAATELRAEQERRRAEIRAQLAQRVPDEAASRFNFETSHIVNKYAARRNEHGDYVLPAVQDAWAGWDAAHKYLRSMLSAAPTQQAPVQGEPYGCVTVVRRLGCADQHWFYRHPEPPYLDNASECVTVYTTPQQAREPMTEEQKRQSWINATIEQCSHENCYLRGIEDAERHHKIGEKQ